MSRFKESIVDVLNPPPQDGGQKTGKEGYLVRRNSVQLNGRSSFSLIENRYLLDFGTDHRRVYGLHYAFYLQRRRQNFGRHQLQH